MTHTLDDLWRLLREAREMPYGTAQIALVEQIIRHADVLGDRHLSFAARMLGTTAYTYGGAPAKSFVTFSWCVADFDQHPAPYHQRHAHNLLWHFKWMVNALTKFPEVPLDRTYSVLDDMERRYRDGGHSPQAVYKYRYVVAQHVGAVSEAEEWYARWMTAPRDELSDCAGCDPTAQVRHLADCGRDEEAVALAEPLLTGRLSCTEQPQAILTALLLPYLRTGRREQAREAHRRAYRLIRGNLADLHEVGEHLAFCARTGNEARGLEIVERHLDWLDRAPSPAAAMEFAASAALVLGRLADAGLGADLTVHRGAHGSRPAREVPVGELARELSGHATELAARFDVRNGGQTRSRYVAKLLAAEPIGDHLPLSATVGRHPRVPAARRSEVVGTSSLAESAPAGAVSRVAPDEPVFPADASASRLLTLAEEYELVDETAAVTAVLAEFDDRFGEAELAVPLMARRAELSGHERYRADDMDGAETQWRRAVELYRSAGESVRAWSTLGRLGVLRCLRGATDEGMELVRSSAEFFAGHGAGHRHAAAMARVGIALLAQERLAEALQAHDHAAQMLTEAYGTDVAVDDGADRAVDDVADSLLAVAHLSARITLVRAQILRQLDRPEESRVAAAAARDAYRRLGATTALATACLVHAQSLDDPAEAVHAYDEAVRAAGTDDISLDARLGRARVLVSTDRAAEAIDDFVEVIGACAERGIDDGVALTRFELARAYHRVGRYLEAAEVGEEALVGLTRVGAQGEADRCRHMLATVYIDLGEEGPALEMLDQLATNLDGPDNLPGRGQVLEEAGELLDRLDRDALAAQRFTAAADAYRLAGLHVDQLRAHRRQAIALHWAGDPAAAAQALRLADEVSMGLPDQASDEPATVWERAMLGYDAARVLIGADRLDEALVRVAGVSARFRSIEAFGEALHTELLHGEVLLRLDRPGDAEPMLRAALAGLPRDSAAIRQAAWLLARALSDLGRSAEAAVLRSEYDLAED